MRLSPQAAQAGREGGSGFLTVARSPSCAALKIRFRSRPTLSSWRRQSTASHSGITSAGPFTMRCPTCPSVRRFRSLSLQRLTCPRRHPFRGRVIKTRYPASSAEPAAWRGGPNLAPISCRLSPTGVRFLDILSRQRVPPPSRLAYQPPRGRLDSVGVSVFRTYEMRPGWVPSLLRGGGVVPTAVTSTTGTCRFSTASPVPRWSIPSAGAGITKHTKIHLRSPVRSSPCPPSPDGTGTASASPLGFAPHSHP